MRMKKHQMVPSFSEEKCSLLILLRLYRFIRFRSVYIIFVLETKSQNEERFSSEFLPIIPILSHERVSSHYVFAY